MREAILQDNRLSWLQPEGADNDVVLASRILLSRNLRDKIRAMKQELAAKEGGRENA